MAKSPIGEARENVERASEETREYTRRTAEQARDFAERGAKQANDAANYGFAWMRELANQSVAQSKVVFEGFFTTARRTFETLDQQAAEVRRGSISFAEEAFANTFDFAQKCARVSSPQDVAKLQTEYLERQAQIFADHSKDLGQKMMQVADEAAKSTMAGMQATGEQVRRRAENLTVG
ncbi:MAG TPA: phasin family protein [Xanthobacteraceae bacterium]|jgi:hypothetical protein|nr:phasin family protein [Xanthobacteraceae bacterium]